MEQQIIEIDGSSWRPASANADWIAALEAGKVLYFPNLAFELNTSERRFLTPEARDPKARNISLDANGRLKGAAGDAVAQAHARRCLPLAPELRRTHLARIHQRQSGRRAARLARGRTVRTGGATLPAARGALSRLAGRFAARLARDQVAAQRIRSSDVATA